MSASSKEFGKRSPDAASFACYAPTTLGSVLPDLVDAKNFRIKQNGFDRWDVYLVAGNSDGVVVDTGFERRKALSKLQVLNLVLPYLEEMQENARDKATQNEIGRNIRDLKGFVGAPDYILLRPAEIDAFRFNHG